MSVMHPLVWHPKRFLEGDLDNSASDRLLGNPKLSKLETLIREMAQNSWDARTDDGQPAFRMLLRKGSEDLRSSLRLLLRDDAADSPLATSLLDPNFHVLEILDRGTSGLDGPIDMSEGDPSNFQDLILKVGVPRSGASKGGGTFGFGKTAAYAYSRIGTLVYWTRCKNQRGELEHRFIVSAFRDKFVLDGVQYTGRHWWGATSPDGGVAPIVGERAQRLGESLFARTFPGEETGTSILILDPPLRETVETAQDMDAAALKDNNQEQIVQQWTRQARKAIRRHLWPKLVPHPATDQAPMDICLEVHDEEISLVDEPAGAYTHWATALNGVRAAQECPEPKSRNRLLTLHEVTHQGSLEGIRKSRTLGHLAILRRYLDLEDRIDGDDLDPAVGGEVGRVMRMRNEPELVVNSRDYIDAQPMEGMDWLAVFKPTIELDDIYAKAEPPAHDDWVSEGLDRESQLIIQHTDRRIRKILQEQLLEEQYDSSGRSPRVPTAKLSKKLAGLLPAEPAEQGRKTVRQVGRRPAMQGPRAVILSSELVRTDERVRQVHKVVFKVEGPGDEAEIQLIATFIGNQAREEIPAETLDASWYGATEIRPGTAVARVGETVSVFVHAEQGRALALTVNARALNGND